MRARCSAASPAGKAGRAAGVSGRFAIRFCVRINETAPFESRGGVRKPETEGGGNGAFGSGGALAAFG